MLNMTMEQLVAQVPELNLRKRVETRTTHWSDVRENPALKEGEVVECVSWVTENGFQWTSLHLISYIKTRNLVDAVNVEELVITGEFVS